MKELIQIRNKHKGEIIYILGAGQQMELYRPLFFEDKIAIGINWVYKFFPVTYTVSRHMVVLKEAPPSCIYPEITCDMDGIPAPKIPGWIFRDELTQHGTTAITAIDAAVYLGAKKIIVLGCEGYGEYFKGYPTGQTNQTWLNRSRWEMEQFIHHIKDHKHVDVQWIRLMV